MFRKRESAMPAPYILEQDVINEAKKYFHGDDLNAVLDKLTNTQLWADFAGPPARIHLAMIWKSKGDLNAFLRCIQYDSGDWRDLLVEMKLGDSNWEKYLEKCNLFPKKWAPVE
jgi:hypothetical protein